MPWNSGIFPLKKSQGNVVHFTERLSYHFGQRTAPFLQCFTIVSTVPAEFHVMACKSDTSSLQHNLTYMIQHVQSQGQDRQGGRPVQGCSDFWQAFQLIHRVSEGHWLEDKDKTYSWQQSFPYWFGLRRDTNALANHSSVRKIKLMEQA